MSNFFTTALEQHPRPLHLDHWQRVMLGLVGSLPPHSSFSRRILRLIYGKRLKHMSNTGASLRLVPGSQKEVWEIHWKGAMLGKTVPFPGRTSASTLWLLATGPSINDLDLTQLRGRTVMGVNGATSVCRDHDIVPSYYVSTDPDFFENRMELIALAIESGAHCFLSANGISRICEQRPELLSEGRITLLETVNRYWGIPQFTPEGLCEEAGSGRDVILPDARQHKVGWSKDPSKGVFASNTVTYSACQVACAMGFSRVNILGMDLGADKSGAVRAYEQGSDARPSKLDESYHISILPAFELMSSLELTTEFVNLSPHSRLPDSVMPKAGFQSAILADVSS